ncbi:MAG: hypothetical protein ACRDPQ_16145 [Nocardioidaceae bacterium]
MNDDAHWDEVERLWRLCRRDLGAAIKEMAGYQDGRAWDRLVKNWKALCDLDLDVAAALYHGIEQVQMAMSKNGVTEHRHAQMRGTLGVLEIGRQANPDAETQTVGELYDLGKRAISDDIDHMTDAPDDSEGGES